MENKKRGLGKNVLFAFLAGVVFYLAMAFILPGDSKAWDRLMQFAPILFGSASLVEILVGVNKYKEKSK